MRKLKNRTKFFFLREKKAKNSTPEREKMWKIFLRKKKIRTKFVKERKKGNILEREKKIFLREMEGWGRKYNGEI